MQLAKIVGNVVMGFAHESVDGNGLFVCQPVDENGGDTGAPVVAVSPFGGGLGSTVLITTDGSETRKYVGDDHSPLRNSIICILDD